MQPETAQSRAADVLADQGIAALQQNRIAEGRAMLEQAVRDDEDCLKAHLMLSKLRFPGDYYLDVLTRIHAALQPRHYIEIGVATGASMVRALPTTRCIGVDPTPALKAPLGSHVEIHSTTSNEFFATDEAKNFLGGVPLDLGFIDGMHLFENALEDFINLERHCGSKSVLMLHDCLPLNHVTAARERRSRFWTGDVWRLLPTLTRFRPDLIISAIECEPSGLTIVRGLDPTSDVLSKNFDDALAFGFDLPFEAIENYTALGIRRFPSHWDAISQIFS